MSRLLSMRRRLTAQIDGLNWAAEAIEGVAGDVLEVGLGNGRTYDHLRHVLPDRRIWVIDRVLQPHPSCVPPDADFLQGEAEDMMDVLAARGVKLALAHCDFGVGVAAEDEATGARLAPHILPLMVPGGLVLSQPPLPGFQRITGPKTVTGDRYHFYRVPPV